MSILFFPIILMLVLNVFSILVSGSWFGDYTYDQSFFVGTDIWGAVIGISSLMILAGLTGITVFGTGLNTESVRIILMGIFYIALWFILSWNVFPLISSITVFGNVLYAFLSIIYIYGVAKSFTGSE